MEKNVTAMAIVKNRHGVEMNFATFQRQMDSELLVALQSLNHFEDDHALLESNAEGDADK